MAGIFKKWTVLPHGKLTPIGENLLTVVGELPMPAGEFPRRMTVVRLRDSRLVIFSAIALDESEMQALDHSLQEFLRWSARFPEPAAVK